MPSPGRATERGDVNEFLDSPGGRPPFLRGSPASCCCFFRRHQSRGVSLGRLRRDDGREGHAAIHTGGDTSPLISWGREPVVLRDSRRAASTGVPVRKTGGGRQRAADGNVAGSVGAKKGTVHAGHCLQKAARATVTRESVRRDAGTPSSKIERIERNSCVRWAPWAPGAAAAARIAAYQYCRYLYPYALFVCLMCTMGFSTGLKPQTTVALRSATAAGLYCMHPAVTCMHCSLLSPPK